MRAHRRSSSWRLVLVVSLCGLLAACGVGGPARVSLAELVAEAERRDGDTVRTTGVVREFTADEALVHHFVVEDAANNRVQLVPNEAAAAHVDEQVEVTGTFRYDESRGRVLEVEEITPVEEPAGPATAT